MTKEKLNKMIITLLESKLKSYTGTTVDLWIELLHKLPDDKLEHAFKKMIYSDEEFPSVGKIVKACQPDYKQIAASEWFKVMKQIGRGDYNFEGTIKDVLEDIGGARPLGKIEHPIGLHDKQMQFMNRYINQKEIDMSLKLLE